MSFWYSIYTLKYAKCVFVNFTKFGFLFPFVYKRVHMHWKFEKENLSVTLMWLDFGMFGNVIMFCKFEYFANSNDFRREYLNSLNITKIRFRERIFFIPYFVCGNVYWLSIVISIIVSRSFNNFKNNISINLST